MSVPGSGSLPTIWPTRSSGLKWRSCNGVLIDEAPSSSNESEADAFEEKAEVRQVKSERSCHKNYIVRFSPLILSDFEGGLVFVYQRIFCSNFS